jgi:hypothetical protein
VAGRVLRSPSGPVKSLVIRRSLAGGIGEAQRGDVLSRQFRRRWICGNAGERARIPHDLTHPGTGGRGGAGMSEIQFTYALDFVSRRRHTDPRPAPEAGETVLVPIPRIARLLALAIRLQELVRKQKIRDYAEAAHLGRVTRARSAIPTEASYRQRKRPKSPMKPPRLPPSWWSPTSVNRSSPVYVTSARSSGAATSLRI